MAKSFLKSFFPFDERVKPTIASEVPIAISIAKSVPKKEFERLSIFMLKSSKCVFTTSYLCIIPQKSFNIKLLKRKTPSAAGCREGEHDVLELVFAISYSAYPEFARWVKKRLIPSPVSRIAIAAAETRPTIVKTPRMIAFFLSIA